MFLRALRRLLGWRHGYDAVRIARQLATGPQTAAAKPRPVLFHEPSRNAWSSAVAALLDWTVTPRGRPGLLLWIPIGLYVVLIQRLNSGDSVDRMVGRMFFGQLFVMMVGTWMWSRGYVRGVTVYVVLLYLQLVIGVGMLVLQWNELLLRLGLTTCFSGLWYGIAALIDRRTPVDVRR